MSSNPFATRHIRPGALEFIFPPGQSAASLVEQLQAAGWLGQIIGPHGSGKSTLLAALLPALAAAGRTVVWRPIRADGQTGASQGSDLPAELTPTSQVVIDGYEQLSWWLRRRWQGHCRRYGAGLLITAHADAGLPTLFQTQPTLEVAQQVVRQLLEPNETSVSSADVAAAWQAAQGNLRETLFKLFDVYQARRGQVSGD